MYFWVLMGEIFSQRAPEALPGKDSVFWLLYGPEAFLHGLGFVGEGYYGIP